MSGLLDQLTFYMNVFLVVLVVISIIVGVFVVMYRRKTKGKGIHDDNGTDYSHLERKDSEDYLKFDDIKDGMIICDNGYRFVGVIKCNGIDFYNASPETQGLVARSFAGFVNTITKPITYRQYSKAVDMDYTLERYRNAYNDLGLKLYEVNEEIRSAKLEMQDNLDLTGEEKDLYLERIGELERQKKAIEWRQTHMLDQMGFIRKKSGSGVAPEQEQTWVFDWTFDNTQFTVELTKEQIYERAVREVDSKARTMIHSLQNCGVRAVRCTTEDLIEMVRRYSSPISADRFRMRDVLESSFFDDINISRDIDELVERGKESMRMQQEEYMNSPNKTLFQLLDEMEQSQEEESEDIEESDTTVDSPIREDANVEKQVESKEIPSDILSVMMEKSRKATDLGEGQETEIVLEEDNIIF